MSLRAEYATLDGWIVLDGLDAVKEVSVMAKCGICGKYGKAGSRVSHSMRHTKRRFLPNVQRATLLLDGKLQQLALCTRCLRSYHKVVVP